MALKGNKDGESCDLFPLGEKWQFRSWIMIWLDLFLRRIFLEAML